MHSNNHYNKNLKSFARKLRKDSTPGEIKLWSNALSRRQMKGYRFLRQRPILFYIADFFCKELKLVIEVDGYSHLFKVDEDKIRDKKLNLNGYKVLRVFEEDVMHDFENVVREIEYTIEIIEREPGFKGERKL